MNTLHVCSALISFFRSRERGSSPGPSAGRSPHMSDTRESPRRYRSQTSQGWVLFEFCLRSVERSRSRSGRRDRDMSRSGRRSRSPADRRDRSRSRSRDRGARVRHGQILYPQGWWRQVPEGIPPKGGLPYTLLPIWMASSCEMKYSPKFIKTRLKTVKIQIKEAKLNKYIWETMFDSWSMWYPTYWTSK